MSKGKHARDDSSPILESKKHKGDNLFRSLLIEGSLTFTKKGSPYIVADASLLKHHLEKALANNNTKRQEFLALLESHIQKPETFRTCLLPTEQNESYSPQDTLIKILLGVECLQPELIDLLLQKLSEFISDESVGYGENVPKMILGQFRWLDHLVDNKRLTNKLIETLELCAPQVKKDLIAFIPDVVEDSGHAAIVEALKLQMTDDPQLTVPIVDCFSNLNLPLELTSEVQNIVLDTLNSASMDDLPVLVGFLLQSVNAHDAQEVVKDLRQRLDFSSVTGGSWDYGASSSQIGGASSSQKKGKQKVSKTGGITLTLEAMKSAIRFKKELVDAFFKQIQAVESALKHKVLDLWVLFMLHSMVNQRKAVVACFRKKIINGHFTIQLLRQSLANHADALREYFRDLVALAEGFLRAVEPSVRRFGVELYTLLFAGFRDKILRQDILGSIATHIGASGEEINSGLDVLQRLSVTCLQDLVPFSTFLKGMLDYIDPLTDSQLRILFSVFSSLAFVEAGMGSSSSSRSQQVRPHLEPNELIHDDMMIFIRKQLMNSSMKYKRMGIIGAVNIIKRIGATKLPNALDEPEPGVDVFAVGPLHDDLFERVKGLIDLVYRSCGNSQMCVAFFYDEIVNAMQVGLFNPRIVEYINEKLDDDVRNDYILEMTKEFADSEQLWGSIDGAFANIVISVYPLASQPDKKELLMGLCPLIRLLQTCVRIINDNTLGQIEGVLGCPLLFYSPSVLVDFAVYDDKEAVALCLFHAINWCRELINAFSIVEEMRAKVVTRLTHVIELEVLMESCLEKYPAFKVPHYIFWSDPKKGQLLLNKKKKTTKKSKKKGEDKDASPEESNYGETPNVSIIRPYLRQFDLSALQILTYTILNDSIDSQSESSILELDPLPLRYLLEDFHSKLSLVVVPQKKAFPAAAHKDKETEVPPSNFLSVYPDPRLAIIEMRTIFSVIHVHLERVVEALLALNSKIELGSQSIDLEAKEEEAKEDSDRAKQLRKVWMDSAMYILSSLEKLFSYEDLYTLENELIIRSIFNGILELRIQQESKMSFNFLDPSNPAHSNLPLLPPLREKLFTYLEGKFAAAIGQIGEFSIAVSYVNMMSALVRHKYVYLHTKADDKPNLKERVSDISEEYLKKKWTGKLDSKGISTLVTKYLEPKQPFPALANLVALLPEVAGNKDKDDDQPRECERLKTLTDTTLPYYFVVLFTYLTKHLQTTVFGNQVANQYTQIKNILEQFRNILAASKYQKVSHVVVACALRHGKTFLETFIKRVLPIFKATFAEKKLEIVALFKPLQTGTRILQSMCDMGKITGSTALLGLAPAMRKALELLVYRIELLLANSEYKDQFSIANLRHKDLDGQEVSSQSAFNMKKKKTKATKAKKASGKSKAGEKKGKKKGKKQQADEDEGMREEEEDPVNDEDDDQSRKDDSEEIEEAEEPDNESEHQDDIEEEEHQEEEEEEDIDETAD